MGNIFSPVTRSAIDIYRHAPLGLQLCGSKPFGSRHWEYPWCVEQSGILTRSNLRILDVAPDFTFPFASFIEERHRVTFIDLEGKKWSDTITWGAAIHDLTTRSDYRIMDVRQMSFSDETFDVIFCISVLEHIVCPTQNPDHPGLSEIFDPKGARPALAEMKRCLKPGGRLLLTVDLYGGSRWKRHFERWDIFSDLASVGFHSETWTGYDRQRLFDDPDTFISQYYGPYITLGFCLTG
jgi:SAM-dependent methyltransferase